jgi:hypothetical protein
MRRESVLRTDDRSDMLVRKYCERCGDWLPLGHSDEHASEAVEIEVRAAEIADDLTEADRLCDWTFGVFGDDEELRGWSVAESNIRYHSNRWLAGYLARQIVKHGEGES